MSNLIGKLDSIPRPPLMVVKMKGDFTTHAVPETGVTGRIADAFNDIIEPEKK